MKRLEIEIGTKFNRLSYTGEAPPVGKFRYATFLCDCGKATVSRLSHVSTGATKSCGCVIGDSNRARTRHGNARRGAVSAEYSTWAEMRKRCENPKQRFYRHYGGRGIKVCDRWQSFENFLADMGKRPLGMSIDRYPDVNGNYEPGNCRWATDAQQASNKRQTLSVEFGGKTQTVKEWAAEFGLGYYTLRARLFIYGWTVDRAISTAAVKGANQYGLKS